MSEPILLATLGLPGVGKTHFSRCFALKHGMYHLNSDHLRHELYIHPQYTEKESRVVFYEMERIAHDKLSQGISLIFDANATRKMYRDDLQAMAKEYNAKYCLMWFKSDMDRALTGIKRRKEIIEESLKKHHITLDEDVAKRLVEDVGRKIEEPGDEPYVELDAHKPYEELMQIVESALEMKHLKAIIFDWHGVIDDTCLLDAVKELGSVVGKDVVEIRSSMAKDMHDWNTGKLKSNDFWSNVRQRLNVTEEQFSVFSKASLKIDLNVEMWDYIKKLKEQYKLAILSNVGTNKLALIKEKMDLSMFDEVRFSAEVGKDKSQDDFFLELTDALRVSPHEALFVDDTPIHIEKAKSLGFKTVLFETIDDLKKYVKVGT